MHGRESNQNKLLDCCVVVRQGQGNGFVARMLYFVVKSLHFLENKKNFTYYATKIANQKLNRKNHYLQTLTRRKNIIVTIQIIYRIKLSGL